uniref:Proline rich 35 n=1 Tax=Tetraodon nigroviridis TaxID=99883 RepID=H3D5J3_TETNG
MSKDDTCKVTSVSKHKERKPKKPHYIPRPWGKPYNYKCFQCPFTCMEKSHLYNHMKYSLCKNSLSLLIESDWPYKKGNLVHPEQPGPRRPGAADGERGETEAATGLAAESELLVADVLSLEEQLLQARSADVEAQLKHYKTCLTAPSTLTEQWRLLTSSHRKVKNESAQPRVGGSIPCYPPPQTLMDYQDQTGLNLSMLGVGYPLSPGLFSYMSSSIPAAATGVAAQTPMGIGCSAAAPGLRPHPDRALVPPRLYYPFMCEHPFRPASSQSDAGKAMKASPNSLPVNSLSGFQPKVQFVESSCFASWSGCGVPGRVGVAPQRLPRPRLQAGDYLKEPQLQARPGQLWCSDLGASPNSEASSLSACGGPAGQESAPEAVGEGPSESVAALLTDLSKALQEYQDGERKISHLEKEDLPAQRHLWEHLSKIRSELSHIHQALERTGRNSDSPLDLSVKRCPS